MEKVDDNTLVVEIITNQAKQTVHLERGYLERQRKAIVAQRDEYVAARNKELVEVDEYLAACDKLGIVALPDPDREP